MRWFEHSLSLPSDMEIWPAAKERVDDPGAGRHWQDKAWLTFRKTSQRKRWAGSRIPAEYGAERGVGTFTWMAAAEGGSVWAQLLWT